MEIVLASQQHVSVCRPHLMEIIVYIWKLFLTHRNYPRIPAASLSELPRNFHYHHLITEYYYIYYTILIITAHLKRHAGDLHDSNIQCRQNVFSIGVFSMCVFSRWYLKRHAGDLHDSNIQCSQNVFSIYVFSPLQCWFAW